MNIDVREARALVRRVEEALASGIGDCRSNEVVRQLLTIAKLWVAEMGEMELAAVFPTGAERSDPLSQRLAAHHAAAGSGLADATSTEGHAGRKNWAG